MISSTSPIYLILLKGITLECCYHMEHTWKCCLNLSWTHFSLQSEHILGQEIPCVLHSKIFLYALLNLPFTTQLGKFFTSHHLRVCCMFFWSVWWIWCSLMDWWNDSTCILGTKWQLLPTPHPSPAPHWWSALHDLLAGGPCAALGEIYKDNAQQVSNYLLLSWGPSENSVCPKRPD